MAGKKRPKMAKWVTENLYICTPGLYKERCGRGLAPLRAVRAEEVTKNAVPN
jgi:hypothetical protein